MQIQYWETWSNPSKRGGMGSVWIYCSSASVSTVSGGGRLVVSSHTMRKTPHKGWGDSDKLFYRCPNGEKQLLLHSASTWACAIIRSACTPVCLVCTPAYLLCSPVYSVCVGASFVSRQACGWLQLSLGSSSSLFWFLCSGFFQLQSVQLQACLRFHLMDGSISSSAPAASGSSSSSAPEIPGRWPISISTRYVPRGVRTPKPPSLPRTSRIHSVNGRCWVWHCPETPSPLWGGSGRILYHNFWAFFVPAQTGCICNPVASVCLSGFLALLGLYRELTAEPSKKQTPAGKREIRNFTEFTLVMKVGFIFFSKQSEKQLFRNILLVFLN